MDTKLFGRNKPGGLFSIIDREVFPTGKIWWVSSTDSGASDTAGFGGHPDKPFATWEYAQGTAAAAGDTIFILPGHTETIGADGAAALTFARAGLRNVGLGGRTKKPQILIDAYADTYVSVTAADVTFENIAFSSGHADVAYGFSVAAAGCEFVDCEFLENTTAENFLITIFTTADADNLRIHGCYFNGVTAATECIEITGACNNVEITDNVILGDFSVAAISTITAACLGLNISNNMIANSTAAGNDLAGAIDLNGNATGWIVGNTILLHDDTDILTCIDAGQCMLGRNICTNEFDQEGNVAGAQAA